MISKSIIFTFIAIAVNAALIVLFMVLMGYDIEVQELMILSWITYLLLGITLLVLTYRQKIKGKMRTFLLITGYSVVGFPVFVFAHNAFYALAEISVDIAVLKGIFNVLEVAGFLLAIFGMPLGFLIGVIGTIFLLLHKQEKEKKTN